MRRGAARIFSAIAVAATAALMWCGPTLAQNRNEVPALLDDAEVVLKKIDGTVQSSQQRAGEDETGALLNDAKQTLEKIRFTIKTWQETDKSLKDDLDKARPLIAQLKPLEDDWFANWAYPCGTQLHPISEIPMWRARCQAKLDPIEKLQKQLQPIVDEIKILGPKWDALKADYRAARRHLEIVRAGLKIQALLRNLGDCQGRTPIEAEVQCYIVKLEGGTDPGWTVPGPYPE